MDQIDPISGGRWDDCCPYCYKKLEGLYDIFVNKDYSMNFNAECPFCDKIFEVIVHSVPEFELFKK